MSLKGRGRFRSDHAFSADELPSSLLPSARDLDAETKFQGVGGKAKEPRSQTPELQTDNGLSITTSSPTLSPPSLSMSLHYLGIAFSPFSSPLKSRLTASHSQPSSPTQGGEDELSHENGANVNVIPNSNTPVDNGDTRDGDNKIGTVSLDGPKKYAEPQMYIGTTSNSSDADEDSGGGDTRTNRGTGTGMGGGIDNNKDSGTNGGINSEGIAARGYDLGERSPGVLKDEDDSLLKRAKDNTVALRHTQQGHALKDLAQEDHSSDPFVRDRSLQQGTSSSLLASPLPVTREGESSARFEGGEEWPPVPRMTPTRPGTQLSFGQATADSFDWDYHDHDIPKPHSWRRNAHPRFNRERGGEEEAGQQANDDIKPPLRNAVLPTTGRVSPKLLQRGDSKAELSPIQSTASQPERSLLTPVMESGKAKPDEASQPPQQQDLSTAEQLAIQAAAFQAELDRLLTEMKNRKEETEHMHELLIERTEAATRRVAELEGVVASLNEEISSQVSDLTHLHLQLRAIGVLMDEYLPPDADDTELVQSIQNWKADYRELKVKMAARRVARGGGRGEMTSSSAGFSAEVGTR